MFFCRNFTYNTQEIYLFDTSCYFVIYQLFLCYHSMATLCNNITTSSPKFYLTFTFFDCVIYSNLSGNMYFFQRAQKVPSVGCNWLISVHVMLIGGPGCSSRIVNRIKPRAETITVEEHGGLIAGRSTTKLIFNVRILCGRTRPLSRLC